MFREKETIKLQEKSSEAEVCTAFANLGIDVKIEHPEIFLRLKELREQKDSHFQDSLELAKIIEKLWDKLEIKDVSKEQMILAALLHDIGKSGPAEASPEERAMIQFLFSKNLPKINRENASERDLSIKRIFTETTHDFDNNKIEKYLTEKLHIQTDSTRALDFWRQHAQWTYDILKRNAGGKINAELINIASSHHLLEGINPAGISEEEITEGSRALEVIDKYYFLALVDKYQALMERGKKTHREAIEILIQIVEKSAHGEESKKHYIKLIEKIRDSEEILKK